MCHCSYCGIEFQPRPQVKNPRACLKEVCQRQRQRDNEKAWHKRHSGQYDRQYQRVKAIQRTQSLKEKTERLMNWIRLGSRLTQEETDLEGLTEAFARFCQELGVRTLNKLCV